MKLSSRTRRFGDLTRPIWETILYWKIQHFALRLSPKMSRTAAPATKSHTPSSPNTAPATQNESDERSASLMKRHFQCAEQVKHPSNSANIAPATQNESHPWSASHMKHRFQCVEQGKSPSNFTQYCACHEIFKLKISSESAWSASANGKTIRRYPRIIRR